MLVHAKGGGKQERGAPRRPQQGQQNLTYSPTAGGSGGSHHLLPTYMGDIAPALICGCLSRSGVNGLLLVHRSWAVCAVGAQIAWLCQKKPLLLLGFPFSSTIQEGSESYTKRSFLGRNKAILSSGGENSTLGFPKEHLLGQTFSWGNGAKPDGFSWVSPSFSSSLLLSLYTALSSLTTT